MTKWRVEISEPAYAQHDAPGRILESAYVNASDAALAAVLVVSQFAREREYLHDKGIEISVRPA